MRRASGGIGKFAGTCWRNAVAAGAERIHVSALARGDQRVLVIDDDGVGLASADCYANRSSTGAAPVPSRRRTVRRRARAQARGPSAEHVQ